MHPVLRQMRPTQPTLPPPTSAQAAVALSGAGGGDPDEEAMLDLEEGEGLARLGAPSPEHHPRVQLKRDARQAYVPPQNLFRDRSGQEPEEMRDRRFHAGKELRAGFNSQRVLRAEDFEPDQRSGVSPARAHVSAADLVTAYEQTVNEERNFQKTFNNHVRTLVAREEVAIGLMHLWDFMEAYVQNPASKPLTAQLFLIVQHSRDNETFREAMLNIAEPEGRWLLDLVNILQSIVVQERSLSLADKVAAINYSMLSLGKFYARKIYKTPYVPIDKEVKIDSFYMRMALKVLTLSDDLGVYRNDRIHKAVSASRRRELSDRELMHSLRRALTGAGGDANAESYFDMGADLQWQPSARALEAVGYRNAMQEEDEEEDYEDEP
ncbi:52-55K [Human adenovirus 41]|nr:52-55K [Human adenovirus 41]UZE90326.1 52-55K [Human adenovirus 41]UZE90343.1 52-55K [Human adenovirus 41]UZE90416.1 52-55K [Human adenovirus 41]UZE90542.1 52-55K [Human adenovirus 41]